MTAAAGSSARSRAPLWIALAVGVVVAALVWVLATSKSATTEQQQASSPLLGKPAPEISGSLLELTGPPLAGTGKLSQYRGKWVLVNFFASWCIPCQQEQGDLIRFAQHHQASGDAVIFGVPINDPADEIQKFMRSTGAQWPVVNSIDATAEWGVTGPPESFLVDPNGIVLTHIVGQVNSDALDGLLGRAEASEAR